MLPWPTGVGCSAWLGINNVSTTRPDTDGTPWRRENVRSKRTETIGKTPAESKGNWLAELLRINEDTGKMTAQPGGGIPGVNMSPANPIPPPPQQTQPITPIYRDWETDRKSTRLNSSHITRSRMPSSA